MDASQVDLVDWGAIRVFMYTDDASYKGTAERYKGRRIDSQTFARYVPPRRDYREVFRNPNAPLIEVVLAHYWINNLEFAYFDVGCQYGSSSIAVAQFIEACGKENPVVAFEPGIARNLVPFNLKANHAEGKVRFEPVAVTDGSHPVILFAEAGHSENNRVVNRDLNTEWISYVVDGISIDDYVEMNGLGLNLILKIDTQGAEYEVLAGMRKVMTGRHTTFVMEFTPDALRIDACEWLNQLNRNAHLLNINKFDFLQPSACSIIEPKGTPAFVKKIANQPSGYTDILVVPRGLPGAEALVDRLVVKS